MPHCRFCHAPLTHVLVDLGTTPLANAFLDEAALGDKEVFYPLRAYVCGQCFLVQIEEIGRAEAIFNSDYAYFSSYSSSWLAHCQHYANDMRSRFALHSQSRVVEIASNDGYLLQYFQEMGIPVLGIEPSGNTAAVAQGKGIDTRVEFFGLDLAHRLIAEGHAADLLVGNNVLAHVPDLNDFVAGMAVLLKADGVLTMEFPHLLKLMQGNQFDTIYHEHYSYFSLLAVERIFAAHGLELFDAEALPTHGGSLRVFVQHAGGRQIQGAGLQELRAQEAEARLNELSTYQGFADGVIRCKLELLAFLLAAKTSGKRVVAYGAAAKGNTLLNYCGVRADFLDCVVDASPHKQGRFLPGTRIPVFPPEKLRVMRPDYLLILAWNLREEVMAQHGYIREWGGQFAVPIPVLELLA